MAMTASEDAITAETLVQRRSDLSVARLGDETLAMMNADRDHYYGMDQVGARIWDILEQKQSVGDLCDTLVREYEVAPDKCLAEVLLFLTEAKKEDLIIVGDT